MKAISIQQPWAWAIVHGPKRIENRTWGTSYRGVLLIHAGKSRLRLGDEEDLLPDLPPYNRLVFGAIIGQAVLVDCLPSDLAPRTPFTDGPFCWVLERVIAYSTPIPLRGQLGLFDVPDNILGRKRILYVP